jgi:hypothetical protein
MELKAKDVLIMIGVGAFTIVSFILVMRLLVLMIVVWALLTNQ